MNYVVRKEVLYLQEHFDIGREILKVIAVISMTIDHAGAILFSGCIFLRLVGRLAFPIFCYLLILGVESTRNVRNYFERLFFFALVSQVPYYFAFGFTPSDQLNILFTLSSGVVLVVFYKRNSLLILFPVLAAVFLNFEGNIYGIALIGCMGVLKKDTRLGILALLTLNVSLYFIQKIQVFSLLALPIILLHKNGLFKIERKTNENSVFYSCRKYFFYVYYPLHLTVFYVVKLSFF